MPAFTRLSRFLAPGFAVFALLAPKARAEVRFAEQVVQVGEVKAGAPLGREFSFRNEGPGAAELLEVRPSCGCLMPGIEQRLFQPGSAGKIRLEINSLGQPSGPHTWQLALRWRVGKEIQEVTLEVRAQIVTELTIQPAALALITSGPLTREVVLTDLRPAPLNTIDVRTSSPRLEASLLEKTRDEAGHRSFRIALRVAGDCPEGRFDEMVDLFTSDPLYRHLKIPVNLVRQGRQRLSVLPAEVSLRLAPGQPLASQLLRVRDASNEAVVIEEVTAASPAIQCRWAPGPDNFATVRVQVDRSGLGAAHLESTIRIRVAGPVQEMLTVPVTCAAE
jgi:hypothetical protein